MIALNIEENHSKAAGLKQWGIKVCADGSNLMDGDEDCGACPGYARAVQMMARA